MLNKIFIIVISCITFLGSSTALAQIQSGDITLSINPSTPKANENVVAKIESYSTDMKKSYVVWKLNDEVRLSGVGKTTFSFTLGNINSINDLSVSIETIEGKNITKDISINAANIDILWEATNSYTPPFYKGKTLFAREGEVKVVAVPSFYQGNNKASPNTLSYVWEKDGNGEVKASGFGKNSFTYKNSFLDKGNEIKVKVSNINNSTNIEDSIIISPIEPKVLFYKKDSTGIKLGESIKNNFYINKEGDSIVALPYFFSPKNISSRDLEINWFTNGKQVLNPSSKNELFAKPTEGKTGSAQIKVIINNLQTLFQSKEKSITVNF